MDSVLHADAPQKDLDPRWNARDAVRGDSTPWAPVGARSDRILFADAGAPRYFGWCHLTEGRPRCSCGPPGSGKASFTRVPPGRREDSVTILEDRPCSGRSSSQPDTGEQRVVVERGGGARYGPTGHLAMRVKARSWRSRFDPATLTVQGPATPVLPGVRREDDGRVPQLTFSADGWLAYVLG